MLLNEVLSNAVPKHVGIIMDGNGRWAKQRKLPRTQGHKQGLETAKRIISAAVNARISYVTLYTFSTENWKRAKEEVSFLMNLIATHLRGEFEFYKQNRIRIKHIGDTTGLSKSIQKEVFDIIKETERFDGLTVVLAINYGGRDEIVRAAQRIINQGVKTVCESDFANFFDVPDLPDADMLIRTGGEKRLSNFLLWHAAYAELMFTDTFWPDYTEDEFFKSIIDFQHRNRRFGGLTHE